MTKLIKNTQAQMSMIAFFISAMIAVVIGLNVAWPVIDTSINGGSHQGVGSISFTGNTADFPYNQSINISTETFYFVNGTNASITARKVNIAHGGDYGTSGLTNATYSCTQFVAEVNTNSSLVTASACSGDTTTIRSKSYAVAGNYGMTMNVTGATSVNLTGGLGTTVANMSTPSQTLLQQIPLFLVLVLLMVFVKAII